jgi:hypothetical protein
MSLKQKFLLLILGIVLLPVMFLGTLLFMQVEFDWERSPFDMRLGGVFMTRGMGKALVCQPAGPPGQWVYWGSIDPQRSRRSLSQ